MSEPPAAAYAELQVTSNFSFLRGASHPEELVEQAQALGLARWRSPTAQLGGLVRAHAKAGELGLRFVVGCRLDLGTPPAPVLAHRPAGLRPALSSS